MLNKYAKSSKKRCAQNRSRKSKASTYMKKFKLCIKSNDSNEAKKFFLLLQSNLTKCANKKSGYHINGVSRRISKMNRALKNLSLAL